MGERAQVTIRDECFDMTGAEVVLYTHWGAYALIDDLKAALSRRERWDDKSYLARIIFCKMLHGDIDGTLGLGIQAGQNGDCWREVWIEGERIRITDYDKEIFNGTFEEFLNWPLPKE